MKRKPTTRKPKLGNVVSGDTEPQPVIPSFNEERLKWTRLLTNVDENGQCVLPEPTPPTPQQVAELRAQLLKRIRERVLEKLSRLPPDRKKGADIAVFSGFLTRLANVLALAVDKSDALEKSRCLFRAEENPDDPFRPEIITELVDQVLKDYGTEVSILKQFYASAEKCADVWDLVIPIWERLLAPTIQDPETG